MCSRTDEAGGEQQPVLGVIPCGAERILDRGHPGSQVSADLEARGPNCPRAERGPPARRCRPGRAALRKSCYAAPRLSTAWVLGMKSRRQGVRPCRTPLSCTISETYSSWR